jgi:hypothetical protein
VGGHRWDRTARDQAARWFPPVLPDSAIRLGQLRADRYPLVPSRSHVSIRVSLGAIGSPSAERTATSETGIPVRRSTRHGRGSDSSKRWSAPHGRTAVTPEKAVPHLGEDVLVQAGFAGWYGVEHAQRNQAVQTRRQDCFASPGI